jgi:hypothetical protein
MSNVFLPIIPSAAAMFIADVVLPTPPFWFVKAIICATKNLLNIIIVLYINILTHQNIKVNQ